MNIKRQIIVIPGIMGSVLNKGYTTVWPVPFFNGIKKSYEHLKDISSQDILANKIEPFTYGKLINNLKIDTPYVTEFFYDWRQNNLSHLTTLEEKIMPDADEIIFIAHSMGGIITKLFLNHFSDQKFITKVSKVITLGTPWHGSLLSYKALKYGSGVPDEKKIFSGFVLSKKDSKSLSPYFPSIYQLLPSDNYFSSSQSLFTTPYDIKSKKYIKAEDFFNDHLKISFEEFKHDYRSIISDYSELLSLPFPKNINHFEIIGTGKSTLSAISENSLEEAEGDYRSGDGTVPLFSAISNAASNTFFVNNVEHNHLPKNSKVIRLIDQILLSSEDPNEDNPFIFTSLDSKHNKKLNGKLVKIACPVTASIIDKEGDVIYGAIETIDEEHLERLSQNNFDVHTLGNTTYLFIDENENNELNKQTDLDSIVINAYDKGPTTITIDLLKDGHYTKRNSFKTFEIDPNMRATIKLSQLLEDSKVTLENIESDIIDDLSSVIVENSSSANIIETILEFDTSKVKNIKDNVYVTKNTLELKFSTKSVSNEFQIDETFIKIDNEILIVKNNIFRRSLEPGKYSIKYFSKDMFGNIEPENEISIIVLPNKLLKFDLEFYPQYYKINYYFDSLYEECLDILEDASYKSVTLKHDEYITSENTFKYQENDKTFKFAFNNLFNEHILEELQIDENLILQFFEGTANEQNLNDLMKKYNILSRNVRFESDSYNRSRSAINNEHIRNSKIIKLSNVNTELTINKETEYDLYFLNLSEDINLDSVDIYDLRFKVLVKGENIEQNSLNLVYDAKVKFNNQIIPLETHEITFSDCYIAKINLKTIREKVDAYWKKDQILNFDVSIINKEDNNVIRVQDFIIR